MQTTRQLLPLGTIYFSKATCIYENLAFEEWLFRNHDLEKNGEALLLWSNAPAVVIGRHQCPFVEVNLKYCNENKINIARRHSGGGAVYHDSGNLNISLLTSQSRHCRPRNLKLLSNFLNLRFGNEALILPNQRDDLIFESSGCKISGTAARISHGRAYHHLTLLINVSLAVLKLSLNSKLRESIQTNATRSVRAKSVGCLAQKIPCVQLTDVVEVVADAFKSQFEVVQIIDFPKTSDSSSIEKEYPNFMKNLTLLNSDDWIYGKSPKFIFSSFCSKKNAHFQVEVNNGQIINSIHRDFPIGCSFHNSLMCSEFY